MGTAPSGTDLGPGPAGLGRRRIASGVSRGIAMPGHPSRPTGWNRSCQAATWPADESTGGDGGDTNACPCGRSSPFNRPQGAIRCRPSQTVFPPCSPTAASRYPGSAAGTDTTWPAGRPVCPIGGDGHSLPGPHLGRCSARPPLTQIITAQLHISPQTFGLALGLANSGYAVGTVLTVHDCWEHAAALAEVAAAIQDKTQPLARAGVIRPGGGRYVRASRSLGRWC